MRKTFAILGAALLAACSDATAPGSTDARMQVAAVGDDAPAATAARGPAPRLAQTTAAGTVEFRARVWVRTSAGAWVELTEQAAQQAMVDASGRAGAVVLAASQVEAGTYGRVRVVFEDVRAKMDGSLLVGMGVLSGTVNVDLAGDGSVTVERPVSATASASGTTRLLVNLNAGAWLNHASATTGTVSEAAFASAVTVTAG